MRADPCDQGGGPGPLRQRAHGHVLAERRGGGETERRAAAYQQAGADGLFVPALQDEQTIATLVAAFDVPLNILYAPGRLTYAHLADLGVRRVSTGSLLFRASLHAAVSTAQAVERGDALPEGLPSYAEAAALSDAYAQGTGAGA